MGSAIGTIPYFSTYQPGALAIASTVYLEIVDSLSATSALSWNMSQQDLVGKAPSIIPHANPTASDRIAYFQAASGLPKSCGIGDFGVPFGNLPTGGGTGTILSKLSLTNYDASWTTVIHGPLGIIGTATLTGAINVLGTATITGSFRVTGTVTVNGGADSLIKLGAISDVPTVNAITLNGDLTNTGMMGLQGGGAGDLTLYLITPGQASVFTNSAERLAIASDGKSTSTADNDTSAPATSDVRYHQWVTNQDKSNVNTASGYYTINVYSGMGTGGVAAKGTKIAVEGVTSLSVAADTDGDIIGVSGVALSGVNNGGTNTGAGAKGTLFGLNASAVAASGATNYFVISAGEANIAILTGATAKHRWGWSIVGNGDVRGAVSDAALEIGSTGISYTFGILFDSVHGAAPIPAAGTVIGTDGSIVTVTNFADFHTYTFTGDILYFSNFRVTGAGAVTAAGGITSSNATGGIGYALGAGNATTQITNKGTSVTLNNVCGQITTVNSALASSTVTSFVLVNSCIATSDTLVLNHISGGSNIGYYALNARCRNGTASIDICNNATTSLSEAILIQFSLVKSVIA